MFMKNSENVFQLVILQRSSELRTFFSVLHIAIKFYVGKIIWQSDATEFRGFTVLNIVEM